MKRSLMMTLIGAMLIPAYSAAQLAGKMLFEQGCDAFELVEDLGIVPTPLGETGRWRVQNLKNGSQSIFAFETINLIQPVPDEPFTFSGTTIVAWKFEGTWAKGTNRTEFYGSWDETTFDFTGFFEGQVIRGTKYKTGGVSGTISGNLLTGSTYESVRMVFCKAGFGGSKK